MLKNKFIYIFVLFIIYMFYYFNTTNANYIYNLKKGSNINIIANELKQLNIIKSRVFFILLAKIRNINAKTGYYKINNIYGFLTNINTANTAKGKITLVPGKTIAYYYKLLQKNKYIKSNQSLATIMQQLKIVKPYEGQFFPDTFVYEYGDSALNIFQRSYNLMQKKIQQIWQQRVKNPFINNPYKLLILASLIEKESANIAEKKIIAGVFLNRLYKNMPLQTDPSIIYALQEKYTGKLSKKDLKISSLYNTYINKGLPPGAISSVSYSSMLAIAKPQQHKYLYFVAKNNKEHIFSISYKEHLANIKKYLK